MKVEAKTEPDERKKIKQNEVESVCGLLKIWEEYLKVKGLNARVFSNIPGLGRLLTEEELSGLRRG